MKRKFWNWVRNEGERTLFLNGEISDETWYGDEVTPKLFKDELLSGEGDITAVSYTHLDVYKRQVQCRCGGDCRKD